MKTPKFWSKRSFVAFLLLPLSALFGAISHHVSKKKSKNAQTLTKPVLIVGNIRVGGTGKTPVTLALIRALQDRQLNVGVISRGYGRATQGLVIATSDSSPKELGDEPFLIYQKTQVPLAVATDRYLAGDALIKRHPELDLILSDDGLQHYQLARNFEIAVIGKQKLDNGYLMPAGPLREKADRLNTVDAIVLNGCSTIKGAINPPQFPITTTLGKAYALHDSLHQHSLDHFTTVSAVAGIAHPENFFEDLKKHYPNLIISPFPFEDHHNFTQSDFDAIPKPILMTEKDAVKCDFLTGEDIWVVPQILTLPEAFIDLVIQSLGNPTKTFRG